MDKIYWKNLIYVNLVMTPAYAILDNVDLAHIDLNSVHLTNANLVCANFQNSSASLAILEGVMADGANFDRFHCLSSTIEFFSLKFHSSSFANSSLKKATFREAYLGGVNFKGANLEGANLENIEISKKGYPFLTSLFSPYRTLSQLGTIFYIKEHFKDVKFSEEDETHYQNWRVDYPKLTWGDFEQALKKSKNKIENHLEILFFDPQSK